MDFGALVCKPQKPLCTSCPLASSCLALKKQLVDALPIKNKKTKVRKRFLNYLVVLTDDSKTILTQRKGSGIWQGLYEFPFIETESPIDHKTLTSSETFQKLVPQNTTVRLFNTKEIVHKLSHQHLYTQFWLVKTSKQSNASVDWKAVKTYPVPVLISNFLEKFEASII